MNGGSTFAEVDRRAAGKFARAAVRAGGRQIIYLGGLTGDCESRDVGGAERKRAELDSAAARRASFVRGDLRRWRGEAPFDLIIATCSSLSHLPTVDDTLWACAVSNPPYSDRGESSRASHARASLQSRITV
jgi:hypothetical protein